MRNSIRHWYFLSMLTLLSAALLACTARTPGAPAASGRSVAFDVLQSPAPRAPLTMRGVAVSREDYARFLRWGEEWFRNETFGGERTTTDVAGLFGAELEIPCAPQG